MYYFLLLLLWLLFSATYIYCFRYFTLLFFYHHAFHMPKWICSRFLASSAMGKFNMLKHTCVILIHTSAPFSSISTPCSTSHTQRAGCPYKSSFLCNRFPHLKRIMPLFIPGPAELRYDRPVYPSLRDTYR